MRCLDRDRQRVFIGRFVRTVPVEKDGKLTGRNEPVYEAPAEFWPTVSIVRGEAQGDYFGQRVDYDLSLTIDDAAFEVKEADVLWVDADPGDSEDEAYPAPHDYIVRRVARKGSYTVIAAKRVDVSR